MFKFSKVGRVMALVGALSLAGVAHAELVTNGGFETGNFSGWTQFGNTGATGVTSTNFFGTYIHSGTYGGAFGAVGSPGGIFQTLSTTAGQTYLVSFWMSIDSGVPNSMTFNWNGGADELSLTNAAAQGMTHYTYLLTATGATTDLRFNIQHNPAYYGLDDVSVTEVQVPEPGSLALAGLALAAAGAVSRRKRAA
jgi:hypothetical protein